MSVCCPDCGAVASYGHEIGHRTWCPSLSRERQPSPSASETAGVWETIGRVVYNYAQDYDGDFAPNDAERAMLEDFGNALLETLREDRLICAPPAGEPSEEQIARAAEVLRQRVTLNDIGARSLAHKVLLAAAPASGSDRMRKALEQVAAVCDDNLSASCNHQMALQFVRDVARAALATEDRK